jgi:histidyl-tRNA synthetase
MLLGPGRKDESGDFTKGAGLDEKQSAKVLAACQPLAALPAPAIDTPASDVFKLRLPGAEEPIEYSHRSLLDNFWRTLGQAAVPGINELDEMGQLIASAGYNDGRIIIDPSVVRGLEYYTGPVFEAELTFGVKDERGNPVRFGSVGGGGRYDGLVARFRGEPVPATGFSIGVSRLYAALKLIDSPIVSGADLTGPVVVLVLDRDQLASYQSMVTRLRAANIRAELYLGAAGMKAQMRYADRRRSPCVIIQGSDERAKGEVQIKDLVEGTRAAASIASNEEWKAARPAQVSVPEERLVDAVREILERHRSG